MSTSRRRTAACAWAAAVVVGGAVAGCPDAIPPSEIDPTASDPSESGGGEGKQGPKGSEDAPEREDIRIEGGMFQMGSHGEISGGLDNERPQATREVYSFRIDVYEVTNEVYQAFLDAPSTAVGAHCHPDQPRNKSHQPAEATPPEKQLGAVALPFDPVARPNHPVVGIDWYDAYACARWLGRRLPTEAEWERAARGVQGLTWPWGDEAPWSRETEFEFANCFMNDGFPMTAPVGSFPKGRTPSGLFDMAGNVWEWVDDDYAPYPDAPPPPEDPYGYGDDDEFRGIEDGQKVVRGGGWNSGNPFLLRGALRVGVDPRQRSAWIGFRTAANVKEDS